MDSDNILLAIYAVVVLLWIILLAFQAGMGFTMKEALDKGFAVQCPGKTGVYWECVDETTIASNSKQ